MSDFSELCPIFNTGVYSEVTFPNINMTNVSTSANALAGTITATVTQAGYFTFGRTVVVTDAFVKCDTSATATTVLILAIAASGVATMSAFATLSFPPAATALGYTWQPMTFSASRTFTSTDVLCLTQATNTASAEAGTFNLMVRYREK